MKIEPNTHKATSFMLNSGDEDYPGCRLSLCLWRWFVTINLPAWVLRPHRTKVSCPSWDAATVSRPGRDWYWNIIARQYGFGLLDDFLHVSYGRQTRDSSTEQRWAWQVPWLTWRHVRHSLYDLQGKHYWTEPELPRGYGMDGHLLFEVRQERVPKVEFLFTDFDGESNRAVTYIEEREWHRGKGVFRWLKWFYRPIIHRSLDIAFDKETGPRKGSWKGGTLGHSIKMLPGELHSAAFWRYCEEHQMNFIATVFTAPENQQDQAKSA